MTRNTPYYTHNRRIGEQSASVAHSCFSTRGQQKSMKDGARERICVLKCIYKIAKRQYVSIVCGFKTCIEKREITRYCSYSAVDIRTFSYNETMQLSSVFTGLLVSSFLSTCVKRLSFLRFSPPSSLSLSLFFFLLFLFFPCFRLVFC